MLNAFANMVRAVQVTVYSGGSHVDGEWVKGSETSEIVDMIPIPITPAQLKSLPEGVYQAGDYKFYMKGPQLYKAKDIINFLGKDYEVRDIMPRADVGNFTIYYAKRKAS